MNGTKATKAAKPAATILFTNVPNDLTLAAKPFVLNILNPF